MSGVNKVSDDFFWLESKIMMPAKIEMSLRTTGFRLNDGSLALISPFKFSPEQKTEIEKFGKVTLLIGPNLFHHLYLEHAKKQFPDAKIVGPKGLAKKRKHLKIDFEISNNVPLPQWKGLVSQTFVGGMPRYNELVFCHHPTQTLVATDLIFNITQFKNWKDRMFWKLNWAYNKPTPSALFRLLIRDRRLVRQSVESLFGWDFDRVLMAHGDPILNNGKKKLQEAFTWLLKN